MPFDVMLNTSELWKRLFSISGGIVLAGACGIAPLRAQEPERASRVSLAPVESDSSKKPETADTSRTIAGHVDWTHYSTPTMCLAASRNIERLTDRLAPRKDDKRWTADTLLFDPVADTLSRATIENSRRCGGHFRAADVSVGELRGLLQLALRMRNDTLMHTVLRRQLDNVKDSAAKGEVLRDAIELSLDGHPPRLDLAKELLAQLDAMGQVARVARLRAHSQMTRYYREALTDYESAYKETDAAMAAGEQWTAADIRAGLSVYDLFQPFYWKAMMLMMDDPLSVPRVLEEGVSLIRRKATPDFTNAVSEQAAMFAPFIGSLGKQFQPVTAKFVFPAGRAAVQPVPGKLSLFLLAPEDWRETNTSKYGFFASIRRLGRTFGDSLNIIVLTRTVGWTRGTLTQTPEEEAESIRKYFLEYQHLPVTLMVAETPIVRRDDGRLFQTATYETGFPPLGSFGRPRVVLTDPKGKILAFHWNVDGVGGMGNGTLDRLVRRALARQNTSAPTH